MKRVYPVSGPKGGVPNAPNVVVGYMILCPACNNGHLFYIDYGGKPAWSFNGNEEFPTFNPSMLVHEIRDKDGNVTQHRCHSFVRGGKIEFLSGCTHSLAGKTMDLPECNEGVL